MPAKVAPRARYFWPSTMRTADNRVSTVIEHFRSGLRHRFDEGESRAILRTVFQERLGWDASQLEIRKHESLSESELLKVYLPLKRIVAGEPVQYALGEAGFHGLRVKVGPDVLIPRPETEELVDRVIASTDRTPRTILDIGTGSGCIALALKAAWPEAAVTGIDVGEGALKTAMGNGALNGLSVEWRRADVLDPVFELPPADLIISNPPYIPRDEAGTLAPHVIDHEPHAALFVPGDDALVFFRVIGAKALTALSDDGALWFEGHPRTIQAAAAGLRVMGWGAVRVIRDLSGNERFLHATR